MSTDIKLKYLKYLFKAQISKIILSSRSFGFRLSNLGKKALRNVAIDKLEILYLD